MKHAFSKLSLALALVGFAQITTAGTDTFFNPLTHSASVASPNHINELNNPWVIPAGVTTKNLTSMREVEADITQSIIRVDAGTSGSMFDMLAYDPTGRYIFIPHETPFGAGASRYDTQTDKSEVIFAGDQQGLNGNWTNDYGAFDPARFTPNGTLWLGEEWAGQGRIIEILNPLAPVADIKYREMESIANVAHEGVNFSNKYKDTIYFIDEFNSGSIYKFVMCKPGDYTKGQTFVLAIDGFKGDVKGNWNATTNLSQPRTGAATWIPLTDKNGTPLTATSPFDNTNLGGRIAADEAGGTPFGRPEDMEVSKLANGREVFYFTATSEQAVYSVEVINKDKVVVREYLSEKNTPKNLGFQPTTGVLNSPDNLAQDALGNIYVIEDSPNGDNVGGDIWFARDTNSDGVAESLDHFMSIQVDGSEATGMIFNPAKPTKFVVSVQHPDSTDLKVVPTGLGDAIWEFDLATTVPPLCTDEKEHFRKWDHQKRAYESTCTSARDYNFVWLLETAHKMNKWPKDWWKH
jgi:uncharacterized protein